MASLSLARDVTSSVASSEATQLELEALTQLEGDLGRHNWIKLAKKAKYQHYSRTQTRPKP